MDDQEEHLAHQAATLASAAAQLAESVADPSSAPYLASALGTMVGTLDALAQAWEGAARTVIPSGDRFERIGVRFTRAAESWQATHDCDPPSHERQALLLTRLYGAGATMRVARRECDRATGLLIEMTTPLEASASHRPLNGSRSSRSVTL